MIVGFHPVADNPVRMAYVPEWRNVDDLTDRLGDLEHAVGEGRVVPAPWEPFYEDSPSCRYAGAYGWARAQLQNPQEFATALALFPGEGNRLPTRISHANWIILCTRGEPSRVTRRLMLAEVLGVWEHHATEWLEKIVETCAALRIDTSVALLRDHVHQALQPLARDVPHEESGGNLSDFHARFQSNRGFEKDIMQMGGWSPDPGLVILPVDGKAHALSRQILRLDLSKAVLLRSRKPARVVEWEKITLVHLLEGAVTFEITGEPPLIVAGYKNPESVLEIIQQCYKAATERLLQALADTVIRPMP